MDLAQQVRRRSRDRDDERGGTYCRTRGLHTTQLATWRAVCEQANSFESANVAEMKSAAKAADKRERQLARGLSRKERALAEAAALLALRGKLVARYGEDEDG